jgi:hypothetical protein
VASQWRARRIIKASLSHVGRVCADVSQLAQHDERQQDARAGYLASSDPVLKRTSPKPTQHAQRAPAVNTEHVKPLAKPQKCGAGTEAHDVRSVCGLSIMIGTESVTEIPLSSCSFHIRSLSCYIVGAGERTPRSVEVVRRPASESWRVCAGGHGMSVVSRC